MNTHTASALHGPSPSRSSRRGGHLAAALPPRRGRRAGAAVPRSDAAAVCAGRAASSPPARRQAAPDVRHLQQSRPAARAVLPEGRRPRLHALALPRSCSRSIAHDFTVFSGVSHPNVDGGHPSDICFLTAAPHPASSSFRNTISLDQLVAERIGMLTRFPSLTLAVNGGPRPVVDGHRRGDPAGGQSASEVFNQLFLQGTPAEVEAQIRELDTGRSILDAVAEQAKDLQRRRRRARPRPARPVFHQRPRPGAPAAGVAGLGEQAQAVGQRRPRRSTRPARRSTWPRCRSCTTWRGWPSRPTRPAPSRSCSTASARRSSRSPARRSPTATTTSRTTAWPRRSWRSSRSSTNGT